ncbi:MAG: hypothetical protein P4L43_20925 [Syntrophobacteraceae bacterium]|nr:hypothetical protein [Syntrophobacteraceae bacterium]
MFQQVLILLLELADPVVNLPLFLALSGGGRGRGSLALSLPLGLLLVLSVQGLTSIPGKATERKK